MLNQEAEVFVAEKKEPMKDEVREQAKLCVKDCLRAIEPVLVRFGEFLIRRFIDSVINAIG